MTACPDCGKEVKNLGAHRRWCKPTDEQIQIIVDNIAGESKHLSDIINDIRNLVRSMKYELKVGLLDENGDYTTLELNLRIPIRR